MDVVEGSYPMAVRVHYKEEETGNHEPETKKAQNQKISY